jgi:PAS domain S-box-containing protein
MALIIFLSACLILPPTPDAHVKATRRVLLFLADRATPVSSSFAEIAAVVFSGPQKSAHKMAFHAESVEIDSFSADVFVRCFREEFVGKHSVHKPNVMVADGLVSLSFAGVMLDRLENSWRQRYVLDGTLVILAQMLAIFALLWQRSRRKKVELDLLRTNDRLRSAMESGKSVGWEFEIATRKTRWYGDLQTMFGIASKTFTGQVDDFYRYVHVEDRERVSKAVAKARDSHEPYNQEFRVLRLDGTVRWVTSSGEFEYAANGKAAMMRGLAVDITERKQLDEALRISEEKFSKAFRESPLGFTITSTKDHRYIEVNDTYEQITGWKRDEVIGKSPLDIGIWVHPNQRNEVMKRLLAEGSVRGVELAFRTKDGRVRTGLTSAELIEINDEQCALSVIADVTEVKQAEEARRSSEHRFSQFFSTLPEYCYMTSVTGEILDVNPAACDGLGYKKEELLGKPLSGLYAPESALKLARLQDEWTRTNTLHNEEMIVLTKTGKRRTVLLDAAGVRDAQGNLVYVASVQVDITQHKKILQKLRESEERFRLVANAAPVMIWMSGPDKLRMYFNQPWLDFTGRSLHAELGNGWAEGVYSNDLTTCLEIYNNSFDRQQPFEMEYRLRRHDGEYRWILDFGTPRFQQDGSLAGYIGSCYDVTDRKLAQESLADMSRKLIEAQEQERTWIARELHDDINQRLTLVLVNLERVQTDLSGVPPDATQRLIEIKEQLSGLASDVQALSHHLHSSKLEYLGLATAAASFCRELSDERTVQIDFQSESVPKQLPREIALCFFRVLQESLQNAVKHSGTKHFEVWLKGTPHELELLVRDSGVGFDPEDAVRGRGLGLTSMKERLKLVQGKLSVESNIAQGTVIRATAPLPIAAQAAGA